MCSHSPHLFYTPYLPTPRPPTPQPCTPYTSHTCVHLSHHTCLTAPPHKLWPSHCEHAHTHVCRDPPCFTKTHSTLQTRPLCRYFSHAPRHTYIIYPHIHSTMHIYTWCAPVHARVYTHTPLGTTYPQHTGPQIHIELSAGNPGLYHVI